MQIINEYDYLVHLIKSYILGEAPNEIPEGLSFEKVLEFGEQHEVANMAYLSVKKLNKKPNSELMKSWKESYYLATQRDSRQLSAKDEFLNELCKNEIRSLEVQGTVIKSLYPSTDLRMMSDLDFIIDANNLKKAENCLINLGYEITHSDEIEVQAKRKDINIEVHSQFFSYDIHFGKLSYHDSMNQPFEIAHQTKDNPFIYRVNHTDLYLYSLLHLLKHYENTGCGIRRFVDFYYIRKAYDDIDYNYISNVITSAGKESSVNEILQLYEYWFNDKAPTIDLEPVMSRIYLAGNHGNERLYFENRIKQGKLQNKHYSKLNIVIEYLFPKKEYIYTSYPFCKEHNYTTFFCWMHRAFFSVFSLKRIKNAIAKYKQISNNDF